MRNANQDGFMLVGLIVAIFIILLVLSAAAPMIATGLKRDREIEAVHRGNQYVRAIQLYYRKFGRYPNSVKQLEETNTIRFLRQRYADPLTGKDDWRLIPAGQNKTTVKGFFGQPLAGLPGGGLGSASSLTSGIGAGATTGGPANGASPAPGTSPAQGGPGSSGNSPFSSTPGSSSPAAGIASSPLGSQTATDFKASSPPFMGVGSQQPGDSILELNEQTTYLKWEFLYDPRIEKLKGTSLPSTPASTGLSGFGGSQTFANPLAPSGQSGPTGAGPDSTVPRPR